MNIETVEQLRELYGFPKGRAVDKQLSQLEKHSINFINHSPFVVISTFGNNGGVDVSPKGGTAGFVKVLNDKEILIPDSKGNNRIDGLVNIVETGQIGTLFFIPGVDETLRINGQASITADPELLASFCEDRNPPKTGIKIHIQEVFLHCAKAFMRSKLWSVDMQINRKDFPTIGQMINDQLGVVDKPESQQSMVQRYQADL